MLNFERHPLFIEVGMLNEIRYELDHVLISKNPKKIGFISIRGSQGWAVHLGQSALFMCRLPLQEC